MFLSAVKNSDFTEYIKQFLCFRKELLECKLEVVIDRLYQKVCLSIVEDLFSQIDLSE
jgi:hypothetical protein